MGTPGDNIPNNKVQFYVSTKLDICNYSIGFRKFRIIAIRCFHFDQKPFVVNRYEGSMSLIISPYHHHHPHHNHRHHPYNPNPNINHDHHHHHQHHHQQASGEYVPASRHFGAIFDPQVFHALYANQTLITS